MSNIPLGPYNPGLPYFPVQLLDSYYLINPSLVKMNQFLASFFWTLLDLGSNSRRGREREDSISRVHGVFSVRATGREAVIIVFHEARSRFAAVRVGSMDSMVCACVCM